MSEMLLEPLVFFHNQQELVLRWQNNCIAQESGSDVHQHKQALKDLEAKLVVRTPHTRSYRFHACRVAYERGLRSGKSRFLSSKTALMAYWAMMWLLLSDAGACVIADPCSAPKRIVIDAVRDSKDTSDQTCTEGSLSFPNDQEQPLGVLHDPVHPPPVRYTPPSPTRTRYCPPPQCACTFSLR